MIVSKIVDYRDHSIVQFEEGQKFNAMDAFGRHVLHGTENQCKDAIDALYAKYKRS